MLRLGDRLGDLLREVDAHLPPEDAARLQEALGSLRDSMTELQPLLERMSESLSASVESAGGEAAPPADAATATEAGGASGEAGARSAEAATGMLQGLQEALDNLSGLLREGGEDTEEAEAPEATEATEATEAAEASAAPAPAVDAAAQGAGLQSAAAVQQEAQEAFEQVRVIQEEIHDAARQIIDNLQSDAGPAGEYEVALAQGDEEVRTERRAQPLVVEALSEPVEAYGAELAGESDDDEAEEAEEAEPDDADDAGEAEAGEDGDADGGAWAANDPAAEA